MSSNYYISSYYRKYFTYQANTNEILNISYMMAFFFIFFSNVQETQRLMQEPYPGISATPDESNARFFHVLVSGPSEVILNFSLKTITMSMIRHVRIKKNQLFMHRSKY